MKRRSFLLASASTVLALPVLAACGSSGGSSASGGASGRAGSSASAPAEESDGVPVAFDGILRGHDAPLVLVITGDAGHYMAYSQFNETVVSGPVNYTITKSIPHSVATGYFTPENGKVRVLTFDPESKKYATAEVNNGEQLVPTEAPTGATSARAASGMVVDSEFGYTLVAVTDKGEGSAQDSNRVEIVKVKLADGSIDSSATVWDNLTYDSTIATLTISLDGSHVFATEGATHATGISTKDLTVSYDSPADLLQEDMRHPGLIGQVLTEGDSGFTMTSLVDGSQTTFDTTQAPIAAIGQYVYVAQRPKAGKDLESISIMDLSSGQSTPLQGSTLGYEGHANSPEKVQAFFTRDYVVYLKEGEELAVYKLGEGTPLVSRNQDSGKNIPTSAAAYGGYLYSAFEDEDDQLTIIDLASGEDAGTAPFVGSDVRLVSHFGALGYDTLVPATKWDTKPSGSGAKPSDGASAGAQSTASAASSADPSGASANPSGKD